MFNYRRNVAFSIWAVAEDASVARHAALATRDGTAAAEYGRVKIAAVQEALALCPVLFDVGIHRVNGRDHYSVRCNINNRRLHLPLWARIPEQSLGGIRAAFPTSRPEYASV